MNAPREDACWSLVTHFRSVSVVVARDEASGALMPSLGEVGRWLVEFHEAFVEANGRVNDGRVHAYSGRRLALYGDELLPEFEHAARLFDIGRELGMTALMSVSIGAMVNHADAFAALRARHPALQLNVDCTALHDPTMQADLRERCARALRELLKSAGELSLVGTVESMRTLGLTTSEEFNRHGFSLTPAPNGVRPVHRIHHVAPCRDHLSLVIDPAGDIYPCSGMLQHEAARLGSLRAPFGELMRALASTRRNFDVLAPLGPRIASHASDEAQKFPVDLCALHRRVVTQLEAL